MTSLQNTDETALVDLEAFYAEPTIESQLPIVHPNGVQWTSFTLSCVKCERPLSTEATRGRIVPLYDTNYGYRDALAKRYAFEARGHCRRCELVSPGYFTITDQAEMIELRDGRVVVHRSEANARKFAGGEKRLSWWRMLFSR